MQIFLTELALKWEPTDQRCQMHRVRTFRQDCFLGGQESEAKKWKATLILPLVDTSLLVLVVVNHDKTLLLRLQLLRQIKNFNAVNQKAVR